MALCQAWFPHFTGDVLYLFMFKVIILPSKSVDSSNEIFFCTWGSTFNFFKTKFLHIMIGLVGFKTHVDPENRVMTTCLKRHCSSVLLGRCSPVHPSPYYPPVKERIPDPYFVKWIIDPKMRSVNSFKNDLLKYNNSGALFLLVLSRMYGSDRHFFVPHHNS